MLQGGWVVLRTRPRSEVFAAQAVAARGVETYVPMLAASGPTGRSGSKPLFPGYAFARLESPAEELPRVRCAPGVAYVLPRNAPPAFLADDLVEAVRARAAATAEQGRELSLERGDPVTIVSGPFRWIEALFDRRLNDRGRVRILLNLVHGSASIDVSADSVRPLRLPTPAHRLRVTATATARSLVAVI
jgi:transcription antitermination factor NusG